jgi:hypothetical protein
VSEVIEPRCVQLVVEFHADPPLPAVFAQAQLDRVIDAINEYGYVSEVQWLESAEAAPDTPRVVVPVNASRTTVDRPAGEAARPRLGDMDRAGTVVMDDVEEEHGGAD